MIMSTRDRPAWPGDMNIDNIVGIKLNHSSVACDYE